MLNGRVLKLKWSGGRPIGVVLLAVTVFSSCRRDSNPASRSLRHGEESNGKVDWPASGNSVSPTIVSAQEFANAPVITPAADLILGTGAFGVNDEFGTPRGIAIDAYRRIYVYDVMSSRVRVFTERGSHVRDIGSKGEGPGEFVHPHGAGGTYALGGIALAHDTLIVLDRRIQSFDTTGKYLIGSAGDIAFDDAITIAATDRGLLTVKKPFPDKTKRSFRFALVDFRKQPVSLTPLFEITVNYFDYGDFLSRPTLPLPVLPFTVSDNGSSYFTDGDTFHIDKRGIDGRIISSITSRVVPVRVTSADRSDFESTMIHSEIDEVRSASPEYIKRMLHESLAKRPFARYREAIRTIVVSNRGSILVSRPDISDHPYRDRTADLMQWSLLTAEGTVTARVAFPVGFSPKVFRDCTLYGTSTDSDGNPLVLRYTLRIPNKPQC